MREVYCIREFPLNCDPILLILGITPPEEGEIYHPTEQVNIDGEDFFVLSEYQQKVPHPEGGYQTLVFQCSHFAEVPPEMQQQIEEALRRPVPRRKRFVEVGGARVLIHQGNDTLDAYGYYLQGYACRHATMTPRARIVACPNCDSFNITQIADHSANGYNGYICNDCKCQFGN